MPVAIGTVADTVTDTVETDVEVAAEMRGASPDAVARLCADVPADAWLPSVRTTVLAVGAAVVSGPAVEEAPDARLTDLVGVLSGDPADAQPPSRKRMPIADAATFLEYIFIRFPRSPHRRAISISTISSLSSVAWCTRTTS